jgi:hypothetical protein
MPVLTTRCSALRYTVQQLPKPDTVVLDDEANIVEALRGFTKKSNGKFPESISSWGEWAVLFSKDSTDGKLTDETNAVMSCLGKILPFLVSKSPEDYDYIGKGKSISDPRSIVFWHRDKNQVLRAIYNDLSVQTIKEEDLPKRN